MRQLSVAAPGGLDRLVLHDVPDLGAPGPGEIRVRVRASSLNYHDYLVVTAGSRTADGRIPMSDAAGVVEAAGKESRISPRVTPSFRASFRCGRTVRPWTGLPTGTRRGGGRLCAGGSGQARHMVHQGSGRLVPR